MRIAYHDKSPSFQKFIEKHNSVTVHHRNITILATITQIRIDGITEQQNETWEECEKKVMEIIKHQ